MAKPKVFLSSTCFDLSTVRTELEAFLVDRGFEVLNSEGPRFGVTPGMHSHSACLDEVKRSDYLLLMVGKRRGGTFVGSTDSITNEEYLMAEKHDIPRIVCVDRAVNEARPLFHKNPTGDFGGIVDDKRIFSFIDYIASGHSDNWLHPFTSVADLKEILTTQFAHYLTLFSASQRPSPKQATTEVDLVKFPSDLSRVDQIEKGQLEATALREGLKNLYEIIRKIQTDQTKRDAKLEKIKQLFVMGAYGESDDGEHVSMPMSEFKQRAWSYQRGGRVNDQFKSYSIGASFSEDENDLLCMTFSQPNAAWALQVYVEQLLHKFDEKDSIELFARADMRVFSS